MQKRYLNFLEDDATSILNRWRTGLFPPGRYFGYDFNPTANMNLNLVHTVTGFTDTDKTLAVVANQALCVTPQGFVVKEDAALTINGVAVGDGAHDRIDLVVMTHSYVEVSGGSQALYSIITGAPAAMPVAPALTEPAHQVIIGQLYIPTGTVALNGAGVTFTQSDSPLWRQIDAHHRLPASLVGTSGNVSNTEYDFLDGVTSSIQTQIDSKQATITGAATTITTANLAVNKTVISTAGGKIAASVEDFLETAVIAIGNWDMTSATGGPLTINSPITMGKIQHISCLIKSDLFGSFTSEYNLINLDASGSIRGQKRVSVPNDTFLLTSTAAGLFDNANYNDTTVNRGWITIRYTP